MDSIYTRTTEDSLVELAKAGFSIDAKMTSCGGTLRTRVKISKGSAAWGGDGVEILAEAEDVDGAAALRGAVATAETYLHAVPSRAPKGLFGMGAEEPPLPLSPVPLVAEILNGSEAPGEDEVVF